MEQPHSVRVLIRPPPPTPPASSSPPSSASASSSTAPNPPPSNPTTSTATTSSPPLDGVVVVGFIGSKPTTDVTHLINRILDAGVFGSGGLDKDLVTTQSELGLGEEDWFRWRRISYYHDPEKGMVFLQFSSLVSPLVLLSLSQTGGGHDGAASVLEDWEAGDLRGMLFMFSVCHVIVFLHEGIRFDVQILKKFRMLQAAKHALLPFLRSQIAPTLLSKAPSTHSLPTAPRASSASPPSRRGGSKNRHGSAISLMSGTSSNPSVLPGHCSPVILFVFDDDLVDGSNTAPSSEDSGDVSPANQSSSIGGLVKPNSTSKGSGSLVMLARPATKSESSFKKKLHSSLEAQIRFLIKKCRTLIVAEHGHLGPRGAGSMSSLPLFTLDATRVVALLDRSINQKGEPLDLVTGLIEEALNSKSPPDLLSLENYFQLLSNDDIQSIKDFILRQSDTLRGRGSLSSNASSGSVVGVGMVAAAAAAAAASAAAGKPFSAPELPSLDSWLSVSSMILAALLSFKSGLINDVGNIKKPSLQRSANEPHEAQISPLGTSAVEAAVSCLENSKGINMRFSISWCERALPAAKEVYLKDLPACYPTSMHKAQLEKALEAFHSMVKGPAVQIFSKNLEDDCRSIWESGRQLCDAVSLTGRPCMHPRHIVKNCKSSSEDVVKQHSSGHVFLHACACGRSRRLRDDPFDFEIANITFNCFANCENLLPTLSLPRGNKTGPLPLNKWHLMRLGGARYYKPSKGLLQTGFCPTEKYLLKWTISIGKQNTPPNGATVKSSVPSVAPVTSTVSAVVEGKSGGGQVLGEAKPGKLENPRKQQETTTITDSNISFGKGLPTFTLKKPFSEVVAGTSITDSTFPRLQQRKQRSSGEKGLRQQSIADQTDDQIHAVVYDHQGTRTENISVLESTNRTNSQTDGNPFLQIGSNIVPVNVGSERPKASKPLQQFIIYIGFEHECSYGHRFLLTSEHLNELGSPKVLSDKMQSSSDDIERNLDNKNSLQDKVVKGSSGWTTMAAKSMKNNRLKESSVKSSQQHDRSSLFARTDMEKFQPAVPSNHDENYEENLQFVRLDDGGGACSLLNRRVPIYMDCPHCRSSSKEVHQKIKFASTTSQLQRIFLVTPEFPVLLATCPVVQFEESCLPQGILDREQQSRFSVGCRIILPPESFLVLRLPFVYGVQLDDGSLHPLNHLENQPERTAWLVEGTALQVLSLGGMHDEDNPMK
ncbi:uncharacterized protein [Typha latifolia]|uniref:uncharacterized protein n=1 Tax=Typha latifolia TaxID=4733 RepID=UPI003C2EED5B